MNNSEPKPKLDTEQQRLLEHFRERAHNPPTEALPWSSLWEEYSREMRDLESRLRELGVGL